MQNTANALACRQKDEDQVSDPLTMPSEPADHDSKSATEAGDSDKKPESPGLSQILGKVLQQLSVSAWVPAAMLIGNVAVLVQLRANRSYDISLAVKDLAAKPLGTLVILAFSLILATVVTQAFEFEFIRFLEGYFDSANRLIQAIMTVRIRRHASKRRRLEAKLARANRIACRAALSEMLKYPAYNQLPLDYLIGELRTGDEQRGDEAVTKASDAADWQQYAPSAEQFIIDSTTAKFRSYPESNRLLPTRLGNMLRASEDKIDLGEADNLEGYVIRHYDEISPALKSQHDDYRTRLDMYCSLTLVFVALAAASIVALYPISPLWGMTIVIAAYGLMTYISYQAAIASARAYGLVLQEIPQYLNRQDDAVNVDTPSALEKLFLSLLHRNAM